MLGLLRYSSENNCGNPRETKSRSTNGGMLTTCSTSMFSISMAALNCLHVVIAGDGKVKKLKS